MELERLNYKSAGAVRKQSTEMRAAMSPIRDRIYAEGLDWLAQNTDNDAPIGDAIRLLAHLSDVSEEFLFRAVRERQDAIAANDRKTQIES